MAISPIIVTVLYLVIGAVIGFMMALAPGQHNRPPLKHRLILFLALLFGWLPLSIIALTFTPIFQKCSNNIR